MNPLSQSSLLRLQADFQAEVNRRRPLRCVCIDHIELEGPFSDLFDPPTPPPDEPQENQLVWGYSYPAGPPAGKPADNALVTWLPGSDWCIYRVYGEVEAWNAFRGIAADAGRCLCNTPEAATLVFPKLVPAEGEICWLNALFSMAWKATSGSPLVTERKVRHEHLTCRLQDLDKLPKGSQTLAKLLAAPIFSDLPDLARASMSAIDILLASIGTAASDGGGTKRGKPQGRPLGGATKGEALKLFRDWQAAHRKTGISKAEFLREKGLPERDLNTLERGRLQDYRMRKAGRK